MAADVVFQRFALAANIETTDEEKDAKCSFSHKAIRICINNLSVRWELAVWLIML